jgi:hypothetical protein
VVSLLVLKQIARLLKHQSKKGRPTISLQKQIIECSSYKQNRRKFFFVLFQLGKVERKEITNVARESG